MELEDPERDTSMEMFSQSKEKVRGLVGKSDSQRIRIARNGLETFESFECPDGDSDIIPINNDDKEWIDENFEGSNQKERFHNFVRSIEEQEGVDLTDTENVYVRS